MKYLTELEELFFWKCSIFPMKTWEDLDELEVYLANEARSEAVSILGKIIKIRLYHF